MANVIIMPRQGQSVESCLVAAISKKKGDKIEVGDVLFSYETDKSSFDETAKESGYVLEVMMAEGDDVPCLQEVMIIGEQGEDISALRESVKAADTVPKAKQEAKSEIKETVKAEEIKSESTSNPSGEIKISPRAKNYAEKAKLDYALANPTGPNGRIIERDIIELALNSSAIAINETVAKEHTAAKESATTKEPVNNEDKAAYNDIKLPNIRKIIAKSMQTSLSQMAQLTLNSSFDATNIMEYKKLLKADKSGSGLESVTINDILLYAVSRTLLTHKEINTHFYDDFIRYFNVVNLGVAVDTERGLMVPVVYGAEKMSLLELSKAAKSIISETQKGAIDPEKTKNGTFTITNLGTLGVESFTPVINPPQTAILGVNNITRRIKQKDGQDIFYDAMGLSLTFDHRAFDGAPAARFLKDLCANLENFTLLLAR